MQHPDGDPMLPLALIALAQRMEPDNPLEWICARVHRGCSPMGEI
jgi:hypothetical protein